MNFSIVCANVKYILTSILLTDILSLMGHIISIEGTVYSVFCDYNCILGQKRLQAVLES